MTETKKELELETLVSSICAADHEEEAVRAYIDLVGEQYATLENFEESYSGQFTSDEEFARQMAEDTSEMPKDSQWPMYCIDWEYAARELMMDYMEQDGYYFRNV